MTEQELDIVAIQETKIESQDQTDRMVLSFSSRYDVCVSHAVGTSAGCMLLIRQSLGAIVERVETCVFGRWIVCDITLAGLELRIICIYAHTNTEERRNLFETVGNHCDTDRLLVLLGDFNCVSMARDKTSATPYRDASTACLSDIIDRCHLEDVGDCLGCGSGVRFTHFQGTSHARLDRAYVSVELIPYCGEYSVQPVPFSDHCLVVFHVGKRKGTKSKFVWENWKLNEKLLNDDIFVDRVTSAIHELPMADNELLGAKWERFKQAMKMMAIERSCAIKQKQRLQENTLRDDLKFLIMQEGKQPGTCTEEMRTVKQKLEAIDTERYRGAIVRARAQRLIAGEMPTKRAFGLEKGTPARMTYQK